VCVCVCVCIGAWGVGRGEYGAYPEYSLDNGSVYALDEAHILREKKSHLLYVWYSKLY